MGFIFGMIAVRSAIQQRVSDNFLGGVNIMRYGAGPNGVMRTLGQYMLGSGATFG